MNQSIEFLISDVTQKIDQGKLEEATNSLQEFLAAYGGYVDNRLKAEIATLMKLMEYKVSLKEFEYLRSISIAYQYCKLNYGEILENRKELKEEEKALLPERDTIWWCWQQGKDAAPAIIQKCYSTLEQLNKKTIILDDQNIENYVKMPSYITRKYKEGIIGRAHYSDLVRIQLLTTLGGTWIDATTYISGTDQILPVLDHTDLFMYRAGNVSQYMIFDNWFMHSGKRSDILEAVKELLFAYWEKENDAKHYFIFHLFLTMACQKYIKEYRSIPLFSNEPCHVLQEELSRKYTNERWEQIRRMSDVHKLTYRMDDTDNEDSFLKFVLK